MLAGGAAGMKDELMMMMDEGLCLMLRRPRTDWPHGPHFMPSMCH